MTSQKQNFQHSRGDVASVDALVTAALAAVRKNVRETLSVKEAPPMAQLAWAYISDDPDLRRNALAHTLEAGTSPADFMSVFIPEIAATLGLLWSDNKISFVDVTIGCARLQETMRLLSRRHEAHRRKDDAPQILLATPKGESHLLGLFIAAEEMKRFGCEVSISIGLSDAELVEQAKPGAFDMIGVSVSSDRQISQAVDLITVLKKNTRRMTPIVLGGALAALSAEAAHELGADFVTTSTAEALLSCNIDPARLTRDLTP